MGKKELDMTEGNIFRLIIAFALPLILGNLFQQLYNMVDSWVVGNFVSKDAFSAVGTLGSTCNMFIGFFSSFSHGACAVIARCYGSKDPDSIEDAVHTFVGFTLILCAAFTLFGNLLVPVILNILKAPSEVAAEQEAYLRIFFMGISGLLIYNMGAAVFNAIGNSKMPLLFLIISTVSNIVLDLVFVIVFKMGVRGVALATVIAQGFSALLVLLNLFRTSTSVRLRVRRIRIHAPMLKEIVKIGLPAGVQNSLTNFSNMFVQSYINYFGTDVMGGWAIYQKVEQFFYLPMHSAGIAATTFVSQNLGAGKKNRAREGVLKTLALSMGVSIVLMILITLFARPIAVFFVGPDETQIVYYAGRLLSIMIPMHIVSVHQVYGGALRGAGKSSLSMVLQLCSFVLFRQIYLFLISRFVGRSIVLTFATFPLGWLVGCILMTIGFLKNFPKEKQ